MDAKENGEIAYFIQEGDFYTPFYKTKEREKLRLEIEQIISDFPDSFYADSLRQSMAKFQANEAKRQESLQKMKKQAEKPQCPKSKINRKPVAILAINVMFTKLG